MHKRVTLLLVFLGVVAFAMCAPRPCVQDIFSRTGHTDQIIDDITPRVSIELRLSPRATGTVSRLWNLTLPIAAGPRDSIVSGAILSTTEPYFQSGVPYRFEARYNFDSVTRTGAFSLLSPDNAPNLIVSPSRRENDFNSFGIRVRGTSSATTSVSEMFININSRNAATYDPLLTVDLTTTPTEVLTERSLILKDDIRSLVITGFLTYTWGSSVPDPVNLLNNFEIYLGRRSCRTINCCSSYTVGIINDDNFNDDLLVPAGSCDSCCLCGLSSVCSRTVFSSDTTIDRCSCETVPIANFFPYNLTATLSPNRS